MYKVLTIAGSDSCCGAGVQADLKTINALGAYGTCAVTAITVQNTLGVSSVLAVPAPFVAQQIDAVVSDIGTDAVKTGMLMNEEVVEIVCEMVKKHKLKKMVVDPVIKSHKGERLLSQEGVNKLRSELIPLSCLVTPNIPEAEVLADRKIKNLSDTKDAARAILEQGAANVLIKGGHRKIRGDGSDDALTGEVIDMFYDGKSFQHFRDKRLNTDNVHGTGCIYSAAIATELAKGNDMISSITIAREFIIKIIKGSAALGKGYGLANFTPQNMEGNC
ncbi:MAG: bifunctional hydroxymethylpyrimidine kinase/phosphomethylpyrimidine kinase [Planctomycetes bacterium GWA2_40_7]|nr:MAG: bifunctional hydroxymethylpyrimidine kinase/phosphomethylpyrimidine kinase [Planctomycetes bacterium GWA2_40_7]OHB87266.1 MAG: bifunctional hydroxymethylpyrimidine kinase/phosphomethylpyrimidine kinase [Planctomycetes bacterium RIFCSPHIGHO2_02_FULL_40_12]